MISDKWKFDTMQDREFLAKNFDQVSNELIVEKDLLRLDVHISAPITWRKEDLALLK